MLQNSVNTGKLKNDTITWTALPPMAMETHCVNMSIYLGGCLEVLPSNFCRLNASV